MDITNSKVKELVKKGYSMLSSLPKTKLSDFESNIKSKYDKNSEQHSKIVLQIKYFREEYNKRKKEIHRNYSNWFEECSSFIKTIDNKKFNSLISKTKEHLDIKLKINSMLEILKNINENLEKESYIELHHNQEIVYKKIKDVIKEGENNKIEFKSSLRWDWNTNSLNKSLEVAINKTISAFLNSNGGILFIGISDDGRFLGIEKDYPTLRRQDGDGFIQFLVQVMHNRLGKAYSQYISANIKNMDGKDLCIINVKQSPNPVFIKYDNKEEFYIRASATSQPLNVREATEYIQMRWKK